MSSNPSAEYQSLFTFIFVPKNCMMIERPKINEEKRPRMEFYAEPCDGPVPAGADKVSRPRTTQVIIIRPYGLYTLAVYGVCSFIRQFNFQKR